MAILHGIWSYHAQGSLLIFGSCEDPPKRKGRPRKVRHHPGMMDRFQIEQTIQRIDPEIIFDHAEVVLNLPDEDDGQTRTLSEFTVDTLALSPKSTFEWLVGLPRPYPGIEIGDNVRFWSMVGKLTLEMISGQRYYPTLDNDGSIWSIAPDSDDMDRIQAMARSMPRSCAINGGGRSPGRIVRSFMERMLDSFLRETFREERMERGLKRDSSLIWWKGLSVDEVQQTKKGKLTERLLSWCEPLRTDPERPFRACFKLDPPENGGRKWKMGLYLQSYEDPSLLLPAQTVWEGDGSARKILLEDLGKASRVYRPLERVLNKAFPSELGLTTEKAYGFLRETVPIFHQLGLGVMLPAWWNTRSARPGIKLKVWKNKESGGRFGLQGLLSYDWSIAIGDQEISLDEFQRLSSMKVPLVRVKGQWIEIRKKDVEKAIEFFKRKKDVSMVDILRLGSGISDDEMGLGINSIEGDPDITEFLNKLQGKSQLEKIKVSRNFKGKLRPYQERGYWWMTFLKKYGFGACLADDMGLGKTIQLIALLLNGKGPSLVICPMSVVGNWNKELERFAPKLKVLVHHGPGRMKGEELVRKAPGYDVILTTYALVTKDIERLSSIEWENVVVDEAQNIKNHDTKQSRAVKRLKVNFRLAMTGTPVENRLSEMWSIPKAGRCSRHWCSPSSCEG